MKNLIYLADTDTTTGFLTQDPQALSSAKHRSSNKHYIRVFNSFKSMKQKIRIKREHRRMVRRSSRTTYISAGKSFRVIRDHRHLLLLDRLEWAYSSSANKSNAEYSDSYAKSASDVIVFPLQKTDALPSKIITLSSKLKAIR